MDAPKYDEYMIHVRNPGTEKEMITVVECSYTFDWKQANKAFAMRGVYRRSCNTIEEAQQYIRDLYPQ